MDLAFREKREKSPSIAPLPRRSEGIAHQPFGSSAGLASDEGSFSSSLGRMTAKEAAGIALQRRTAREAAHHAAGGAAPRGVEGALAPNRTGLPDSLKTGIERLSGLPMDDVRVHYNSTAPAQIQALAYTLGSEIHVAPGQERHVPHEAWHVVQQKQGRARATAQLSGRALNDEPALEREADAMGARAAQGAVRGPRASAASGHAGSATEELGGPDVPRFASLFPPHPAAVVQRMGPEDQWEQMLDNMRRADIGNVEALASSYRDAEEGAFKTGYKYQIETTHRLIGQVKAVEHRYNGRNRADILFSNGSLGECKKTTNWGAAWKQFDRELAAYAQSGLDMHFYMDPAPPREIKAMILYYLDRSSSSNWDLNGANLEKPYEYQHLDPPGEFDDPLKWLDYLNDATNTLSEEMLEAIEAAEHALGEADEG
ncbi:eCIS core domain-containing protein [Sorangium sp. So ce1389]|uniref:eCIS core domain-containing protein n=1 Tax=Sorangium sp. So ce1389 TaxID=3133336 RepID=UPI003F634F9F